MASSQRQSFMSFLTNISIRRKIFIAFILIAAMLLLQLSASVNSVNSLSNDFDALRTQETIRARAINIDTLQAQEGELITRWYAGEDELTYELFNGTREITSVEYENLNNNITSLQSLDISIDINITRAFDILAFLEDIRSEYNSIVDSFYTTPGLKILNNIQLAALDLIHTYRNGSSYLADYILTNNTDYAPLFNVELSDNVIGEIAARVRDLRETYRILADPDQRIQTIGIGRDINTTLYDEFETLNNLQLSVLLQQADTLFNGIADTLVTYGDVRSMPQEDFNELVADYSDLNQVIYNIEVVMGTFISITEREETRLITLYNQLESYTQTMSDHIFDLRDWAISGTADLNSNFASTVVFQRTIQIIVVVIALILVVILTNVLTRLIADPIEGVVKWSEFIAEGDLSKTKRIKNREDEIGRLEQGFRQMNLNLREIIAQVQKSSSLIANTSEDLASNTEEINATAEEVSAIAQTMAKGSTEQAEIITNIVQELQKSSRVVESVVTQITGNLGIIRDLSEQTNILALNTAIEAANAGDFGKGFTVIAENIRKMSDQTRRTSQRVSVTSQEILENLQVSFGQIAEMIETVASVSEETAASAEEVAASAEEMTASMQSIASNSSVLNEQSAESLDVVRQFKLDE